MEIYYKIYMIRAFKFSGGLDHKGKYYDDAQNVNTGDGRLEYDVGNRPDDLIYGSDGQPPKRHGGYFADLPNGHG
jgi:hypothetical protein